MKNSKISQTTTELCCLFSLSEIKLATQDFHEDFVIGKGGFGNVYKGFINDGIVAIKRLSSTSKQGEVEFRMEIETLSKLRHIHLLSLIGYCNENEEMILVYEYMPKGTIVDHPYKLDRNQSPLPWEKRLKICIGAARGLDYLHTGTVPGVIHRDVKDSNILLDDQFVAKISDFGLAKLENCNLSQSYLSTNVKGTFGYLDPQYFLTRRLSKKTDVYAFGVVLLVILCGRAAVDMNVREDQQSLTTWALESIRNGRVSQIIDPNIEPQISVKSLKAFLKVAMNCLDKKPKRRPNMSHIVASLEFALKHQLLSLPISAAEKVESASFFQWLLQQDYNEEKESGSITTSGLKVSPWRHVTRKVTFLGKVRPNRKVKERASVGNPMTRSWLRGCFLNRKAALVNSQTYYDESLEMSKIDRDIRSAPAEGLSETNSRIISLSQLKSATKNFSSDTLIHEGSLGKLYKGWLRETGLVVVKRCNPEHTIQGYEEWKSYNAKLSGFGLARLGPSPDESPAMTRVMGTFGYIDPEYFKTGQFNAKCDVYGFGVVMIEMLTGLRAMETTRPNGQENLIHWIKPHLSEIRSLELIMDTQLYDRYPLNEAAIVAETALTCLEDEPNRRPSMEQVLKTLEGVGDRSSSAASIPLDLH